MLTACTCGHHHPMQDEEEVLGLELSSEEGEGEEFEVGVAVRGVCGGA